MDAPDTTTPIRISPGTLAGRYGTTTRWWRERLPELAAAGAATKIGRYYFARLGDVDRWLAGETGRRGRR